MGKTNYVTGKSVFWNNLEKAFYVNNDGKQQIVKDIQEICYLAWAVSDLDHRRKFIKMHFESKYINAHISEYQDLPQEIKDKILEYQTDKAKVIPK